MTHTHPAAQRTRVHLLDTESFDATFGPKSQRKRPRISAPDIEVGLLCACVPVYCVPMCLCVAVCLCVCVPVCCVPVYYEPVCNVLVCCVTVCCVPVCCVPVCLCVVCLCAVCNSTTSHVGIWLSGWPFKTVPFSFEKPFWGAK